MALEAFLKVNIDSINFFALSPRFLLDEVHLLHVNADATFLRVFHLALFLRC